MVDFLRWPTVMTANLPFVFRIVFGCFRIVFGSFSARFGPFSDCFACFHSFFFIFLASSSSSSRRRFRRCRRLRYRRGIPPPHRRRRRRRRRRRGRRRRRLAVFMDRPTSKNTKSPETVQTSLKLYKKRVQNDPQNIQNIMKLSEHAFNPIL